MELASALARHGNPERNLVLLSFYDSTEQKLPGLPCGDDPYKILAVDAASCILSCIIL